MNIKETISNIYKTNTNYNEAIQVLNQANSLESLSSDLYTDETRFIYELLQNADDSSINNQTIKVNIKLFDDILVIAHNGKIFDSRDVQGIAGINNGTKKSAKEKTGYKGIGFKSVFGKSQKVTIFSNGEYFKFDKNHNFEWKSIWGKSRKEWENENDREFLYPWQIIPISINQSDIDKDVQSFIDENSIKVATIIKLSKVKEIKVAIKELSNNLNMFLFLKNIDKISFDIDTKINCISIDRSKENEIILKSNNILISKWLIYNKSLEVPNEIKVLLKKDNNIPDKLLEANNIELILAIKENGNNLVKLTVDENLLYSYLPTDEKRYSLPVLVNTGFLTTANRESLHTDSLWNEWLFENISMELFRWISILVKKEYGYQVYSLIPNKLPLNDTLSKAYNLGIDKAKENIPFILSQDNKLLKVKEVILDYTNFSKQNFMSFDIIREFVIENKNNKHIVKNPFIQNTKLNDKLKKLKISTFEIDDVSLFLKYKSFLEKHTVSENIKLIKFLKNSNNKKDAYISENEIKKWDFILDNNNKLNHPSKIYIPTIEDKNWSNQEDSLSFLHKDIQKILVEDKKIKEWLENIGVTEKTDISFLEKTIIPEVATYGTIDNSLTTIQTIFNLYSENAVEKEMLNKLSNLKLITKVGSLLKASECYFSDVYNPKLKIEKTIDKDIFLSDKYLILDKDVDEIKRFFKMMGVQEEIKLISLEERIDKNKLVDTYAIQEEYFNSKLFYSNRFQGYDYQNISTLLFLTYTNIYKFSILFWFDVINKINLENLIKNGTTYWGHFDTEDVFPNYLKWYIQNNKSIPTRQKKCDKSINIFLNTKEIIEIADNYLPIFDGEELSSDWKSFFEFKTQLELKDYLELFSNILQDKNKDNKINDKNIERIKNIYTILLNQSENWSEEEINEVKHWAKTASFLDINNNIVLSNDLKYYIDGDISVFKDMYQFISLNSENKTHFNIENFLNYLNIDILRQSDFEIKYKHKTSNSELKEKLITILPYLENWLEKETGKSFDLENRLNQLEIIEANDLELYYNEEFLKSIQTHLEKDILYISTPWDKTKNFITLNKLLSSYFSINGNDNKFDFLLRAKDFHEINEYFEEENIKIPKIKIIETQKEEKKIRVEETLEDFIIQNEIISKEDLDKAIKNHPTLKHISTNNSSFEEVQKLLKRARDNMKEHLKTLNEYDINNIKEINKTILSGIIKNDKEINIIIRPSDSQKIIIYYDNEKELLKDTTTELWYEDGKEEPKRLSIGKILENTKIDSIPIEN